MNIFDKIKYTQNWNFGFCVLTPGEFIANKRLKPVKWLKHSYKDRWFADPFILKVTEDEIVVFVEECPIENPKGIICELVIDRKTMRLKKRYVLLEKDTHLSYPAIIRQSGKIYVYPENGASGELNMYEYDEGNHRLINPVCILNKAVADATIIETNGSFFLSATKFPNTQENAYLYMSESPLNMFEQVFQQPYQTSKTCSRQGGNWIRLNNSIFRPAQICRPRYGAGLAIMKVEEIGGNFMETKYFSLLPTDFKYNLGLHTINFYDGICVVDACGYMKPILGRLYYSKRLRRLVVKK